jgi:hypothetical protein
VWLNDASVSEKSERVETYLKTWVHAIVTAARRVVVAAAAAALCAILYFLRTIIFLPRNINNVPENLVKRS